MISIGCDIGLKGSWASYDGSKNIEYIKMPVIGSNLDAKAIIDYLTDKKPNVVIVESAQILHVTGKKSISVAFKNYGIIIGILEALKIRYELVAPRVWQKEMFVGTCSKEKPKDRAKQVARRLFPDEKFKFGKSTKINDNFVDASLLSVWGYRKYRL